MNTEVVTIDGPVSSGKNSVGLLLSQKLGYQYIDTGMIYRAGCYLLIKNNIPINDNKVIDIYKTLEVKFDVEGDIFKVYCFGEDITEILHRSDVTKLVPLVAAIPEVREQAKLIQKRLRLLSNTVMTGRDIGSEIFPDSKYKFFLTATPQVRAKRRFEQLVKQDPKLTFEQVLADIADRDLKDSTRTASPLRIPQGAVVIDNSDMSVEETVSKMLSYIK